MTSSSPARGQVQVAITAFAALFSIVGIALYGLPFFYDFMVRDLGWTRAQVTSGNAYSKILVGPLFGFVAGWLIDRFGARRLMIAGIAMAGIALIGLGWVSTLAGFYFFYLFNALGYVCGGPLPCQVLLLHWYDRGRGKAMGFAYLGIGIGGAVVPFFAVFLVNHLGWRPALQVLGASIIAIAMPLAWFVRERPEPDQSEVSNSPVRQAPARQGSTRPSSSFMPILRDGPFYLLLVASMCSIGAVGGMMQNLKLYMSLDLHFAQGQTAPVLSLVLVSSLAGRLFVGWLADLWPKKYVMLLTYSIVAVAVVLLLFAHSRPTLYLFAVVFGIGLGGDYMIIPLMAAELFAESVLARVLGVLLTAGVAAEALAPMVVAAIRDRTGIYANGFVVLLVLAAVGAAAVGLVPKKRTVSLPANAQVNA